MPLATQSTSDQETLQCGTIDTPRRASVTIDKGSSGIDGLLLRADPALVEQLAAQILRPGLTPSAQVGLDGLYKTMKDGKHARDEVKKWNEDGTRLSLRLKVHASETALDLELLPYKNDHLSQTAKDSITTFITQWCNAHMGSVTTAPAASDDDLERVECKDASEGPLAHFFVDKRNQGVEEFEVYPLTLADFDDFVAKVFNQLPRVQPTADELRAFLTTGAVPLIARGDKHEATWPSASRAKRYPAHGAVWELLAEKR